MKKNRFPPLPFSVALGIVMDARKTIGSDISYDQYMIKFCEQANNLKKALSHVNYTIEVLGKETLEHALGYLACSALKMRDPDYVVPKGLESKHDQKKIAQEAIDAVFIISNYTNDMDKNTPFSYVIKELTFMSITFERSIKKVEKFFNSICVKNVLDRNTSVDYVYEVLKGKD